METTIIIPSIGRAGILGQTLSRLKSQVKSPREIIVVVPSREDLPGSMPESVKVIFSGKGTCLQRNTGMDHCSADTDYIMFIDDDTFLHPTYIQEAEKILGKNPQIAGLSGNLLRNGGVSVKEADELINKYSPNETSQLREGSLYGCNFVVRRSMTKEIKFDERLVLYGWLEDADFASRVREKGGIFYASSMVGVHLMYPSGGRANHVRFGFSQVMNPLYLCMKNKKSFSWYELLKSHWLKGVPANLVRSIIGPDRKMRIDRLRGNLIAFRMILVGSVMPEYASEL